MADNNGGSQPQMDSLRSEINNLRAQLEGIIKSAEEKRHDFTTDMAHKIAKELEHCRHKAAERAEHLRVAGEAGLHEVGDHVRQNPLVSLLIAFGAGWVISCLFRHLR